MFGKQKKIKREMDQELLVRIRKMKHEWESLNTIIEQSIEPSEEGLNDLALVKAKYFYLLREARYRGINALS
ncbi:YaaL family protein [Halobacillus kuroshimensis]|uniref:YaaL family protein n=1 Tax=Halobacillus kuroshimensis TaxID=302481 RepID=A0ABS3DZ01_9BACI|nr:YaaL family protein [Halobacillus kuroshimensis]MBN8236536.1 YaaL family protein [Halobacillus kuroshimensis]